MPRNLRIAYLAHSLRSDWNNGNAHFLRGLMRGLVSLGHEVTVYEPESGWSISHLREEDGGERALRQFHDLYPELHVRTYAEEEPCELWSERLRGAEVVILHEWNPPALASMLLRLRKTLGFRLLFHDTHHRASSSPAEIDRFQLREFDGVLAFGEVLRGIYAERYGMSNVWTLHEAADVTVFRPQPEGERQPTLVWIGNWGDDERTAEIRDYLLCPASKLQHQAKTLIYGVRYPEEGLLALQQAGVSYGGYLPNLDAPAVYARAAATVHIPRQQYSRAMWGIPTIRVFEALACGVPLVSAPWSDREGLFRAGDFAWAESGEAMHRELLELLRDRGRAEEQARRGLETVLARHTCLHRARELTAICEEISQ